MRNGFPQDADDDVPPRNDDEARVIDVGDVVDEDATDPITESIRVATLELLDSPEVAEVDAKYGALDMDAAVTPAGSDCACQACRSYRESGIEAFASIEVRARTMIASPHWSVEPEKPTFPAEYEGAEHTANVIRRLGRGWMTPERIEHCVELTLMRRAGVLEIAEDIVAYHSRKAREGDIKRYCRECDSEFNDASGEWDKTCNGTGRCAPRIDREGNPIYSRRRDPLTHRYDEFNRPMGKAGWSLKLAQDIVARRAEELRVERNLGHDGRAARLLNAKLANEANAQPVAPRNGLPVDPGAGAYVLRDGAGKYVLRDANGRYVPPKPQRVNDEFLKSMSADAAGWTMPGGPLVFPDAPQSPFGAH